MVAKPTSDKPSLTLSGDFQSVAESLDAFRQQHPAWLGRFEGDGPVYRLPPMVIEEMHKPPPKRKQILNESDVQIELDFYDLCSQENAVGLWNGRFIGAAFLCETPLPKADLISAGFSPQQIQAALTLVEKTGSIWKRLKGYVGWLVTEPDFIRARDDIASQWYALPEEVRPIPISRTVRRFHRAPGSRPAPVPCESFQKSLDAFLDRWGLTRMVTWDLPEPHGPMLPAQLPANAQAMPQHGVHLVLPLHYPLTGTDDLLHQIRQQQVYLAQINGLNPSMAGLPHFEVYGQMLEVDFLERTIVSRYGKRPRPRGLVTIMEHAIAETMRLSVNQVQKLRKGIVACRKGKRTTVTWLNVSN